MSDETKTDSGAVRIPKSWVAAITAVTLGVSGLGTTGAVSMLTPTRLLEQIAEDVDSLSADIDKLRDSSTEQAKGAGELNGRVTRAEADVVRLQDRLRTLEKQTQTDTLKIERTLAAICAALPRARCPP